MSSLVAVSGIILGKEMAVQTISSTSSSILSRVKIISDNYESETMELFNRLDIKFKLDIITKYIESIELSEHISNAPVNGCIEYIKEIMLTIEHEITTLEKDIEEYNKRWVGNMSSSKFKSQFTNVESHVSILEQRFNMLIKILKK